VHASLRDQDVKLRIGNRSKRRHAAPAEERKQMLRFHGRGDRGDPFGSTDRWIIGDLAVLAVRRQDAHEEDRVSIGRDPLPRDVGLVAADEEPAPKDEKKEKGKEKDTRKRGFSKKGAKAKGGEEDPELGGQ